MRTINLEIEHNTICARIKELFHWFQMKQVKKIKTTSNWTFYQTSWQNMKKNIQLPLLRGPQSGGVKCNYFYFAK